MTSVRAAAIRFSPERGEVAANRRATVELIEAAADRGAELVVLPELATSGYHLPGLDAARAASEPVPGPTTDAWTEVALARKLVIVGGICELGSDGTPRNSAVVVDGTGVLACYRKLHLWGGESKLFAAGDAPAPVVDTSVGRLGLGMCYDLWFPELARDLALRGADILIFPANLAVVESQDGLPQLSVMCAITTADMNHVHVILADRCGAEGDAEFLGALAIVRADGRLLAGPPPGRGPEMALADIDPAAARDKRWGAANDRFRDRRLHPGGSLYPAIELRHND